MRFAIISDIHYPKEITRGSALYGNGYRDSFYNNLEKDVKALNASEIDAFIVCGDFFWDYRYFPPSLNWPFNLHLEFLQSFREWLDIEIPLIFIKGNHDFWFNTYIHSEQGKLLFYEEKYADFLFDNYKLIEDVVEKITGELDAFGETIELVENVYFLENSGMLIKDCFIYGFPYYEKKNLGMPWSKFKELLVMIFKKNLEEITLTKDFQRPIKTILCHHADPPSLKFIQGFENPLCDIKRFYWGHYHNKEDIFLEKLAMHGPYKCVMPERMGWKLHIDEV